MHVTSSVVCFNVDDVAQSSQFLVRHFGFQQLMAFDGFASLKRDDMGVSVVFHRRGLEVLPEPLRSERSCGVLLAMVIADFDAEYARLQADGVNITLPLREEAWGERLFIVTDPNGVPIEIVDGNSTHTG